MIAYLIYNPLNKLKGVKLKRKNAEEVSYFYAIFFIIEFIFRVEILDQLAKILRQFNPKIV